VEGTGTTSGTAPIEATEVRLKLSIEGRAVRDASNSFLDLRILNVLLKSANWLTKKVAFEGQLPGQLYEANTVDKAEITSAKIAPVGKDATKERR